MRDIPFFPARGSAYECGKAIGRAMRPDVHSNVADYGSIFLRMKGAELRDRARVRVEACSCD